MNTTSANRPFAPWDNPLDILSFKDYQMVLSLLHFVIKPVIIVVGVPSNIISCVVFWRQGLGDRMNVCLLALSLVDLCFLLVSMVYSVGYYLGQVDPAEYGGVYDLLLAFISGANHGFRSASGCITMVIAVERCLCVVFPLKAASLISSRNMAVIMLFIVCLTQAALFTLPARLVAIRVDNSSSKFVIAPSTLYMENRVFFNILENIVMMSVLPITTFVVTCLSTGLTVVQLRAAMTWRGQVSGHSVRGQSHHTAVTKMLVVVSCIYILTAIPWVIFYIVSLVVDDFSSQGRYYNLYWTCAVSTFHLCYVNSSVGCYVYFNRSTRFRKDVYRLFICCHSLYNQDSQNKRAKEQKLFSGNVQT